MLTLLQRKKIKAEYNFLEWIKNRFPGRLIFEDPDYFNNPDNIAYFPTDISDLSPYTPPNCIDGDFLFLKINFKEEPGKRIKIYCASTNTEWLLNKISYEDYEHYLELKEKLKKEGWEEDQHHHWKRELKWFEESSYDDAQGMFEEIKYNIIEHFGSEEEQPMISFNSLSIDEMEEHIIMLNRSIAYYIHDFGNGPEWKYFYYINDNTRTTCDFPPEIQNKEEAKKYLEKMFPGREIIQFEYKETQDYSQPKQP